MIYDIVETVLFIEHCLAREDFPPGGSQEAWAKEILERLKRHLPPEGTEGTEVCI